jgi:hypothetical protein
VQTTAVERHGQRPIAVGMRTIWQMMAARDRGVHVRKAQHYGGSLTVPRRSLEHRTMGLRSTPTDESGDEHVVSATATLEPNMVWFYAGAKGTVRVETRHDSLRNEYVLSVERPQHAVVVERFHEADAFDARLKMLETELEEEGCQQIGGPQLLSHGWRGPMSH